MLQQAPSPSSQRPRKATAPISIDRALTDPKLLGAALGDFESWSTWRTILKAAFALPLDDAERATFAEVSGGRPVPKTRVDELWVVAGRRGGKSRMAAALGAYFPIFQKYELAPGETGTVLILAVNKAQAKAVLGYANAFISTSSVLRQELEGEPTADEIRLRGGKAITVLPANFRSVRSRTCIAVVFDEVSFWRDAETSSNPDVEIYSATLPALATTGGMLIGISTPYRRTGLLHRKFEVAFGQDHPTTLVVRAPSRLLNPTLTQSALDRAMEADPQNARAEWLAEWRQDISDFLSRAAVEACIDAEAFERPPKRQWFYHCFVDPSGGAGADSFTAALAHREGEVAVLDVIREIKPPFNPESAIDEIAALARRYHVSTVRSDRYAAGFVATRFRSAGVNFEPTDRTKSQLFLETLPLINSGSAALLDNDRLVSQLVALERRTARGGRETIDHPPGAHDDVANAAAGALTYAALSSVSRIDDDYDAEPIEIRSPLEGF